MPRYETAAAARSGVGVALKYQPSAACSTRSPCVESSRRLREPELGEGVRPEHLGHARRGGKHLARALCGAALAAHVDVGRAAIGRHLRLTGVRSPLAHPARSSPAACSATLGSARCSTGDEAVVTEHDHVRRLQPSGRGQLGEQRRHEPVHVLQRPARLGAPGPELVLEGVQHQEVREQQVGRPPAHDVAGQLERQPVLHRRERTAHAPVGVALDRQAERAGLVPQRTRGPFLEERLIEELRDVVADAARRRASWASRASAVARPGGRGGVPQRLGADGRLGRDRPRGGRRARSCDRAPRCRGCRGGRASTPVTSVVWQGHVTLGNAGRSPAAATPRAAERAQGRAPSRRRRGTARPRIRRC